MFRFSGRIHYLRILNQTGRLALGATMPRDNTLFGPVETPMMRQYSEVKAQHPDALILFRMGDFYEAFNEDALRMSEILGITLTRRANGGAADMPLAGFPYHAIDTYMPKLVRAGLRVAICEQLEDPKLTKKLVKRGVIEVVTPGVSVDDGLLERRENNFLASLAVHESQPGIAFVDLSTGEFYVAQGTPDYIDKLITNFRPKEVLVPRDQLHEAEELLPPNIYTTRMDDWAYSPTDAAHRLQQHFGTLSLKGFGIETLTQGVAAAGAALAYLDLTKHGQLAHITGVRRIDQDQYIWLDRFTLRNLEVFSALAEGGKSLVETIDRTVTPMGARLLRRWLALPLKEVAPIVNRHAMVEYLAQRSTLRDDLADDLGQIGDLERLASRAALGRITPREMAKLGASLALLVGIRALLLDATEPHLRQIGEQMNPCETLVARIACELREDPSHLGKGEVFAPGVDVELDELRDLVNGSQNHLDALCARESARTGITSLKVGFNGVFGYFFEVRNTHKERVPPEWHRKQTLVQAERYVTDELKQLETKILGANDRILAIEARLYAELLQTMQGYIPTIQLNASLLAQLDALRGFAHLAAEKRWVRPVVDESKVLDIEEGWHPVIADALPPGQEYITNSVRLDPDDQQIIMLTGPNMSGKSALLRQTALIVILAQCGSFVPAKRATIGLVDRVFTRVGASDNISLGESTFMVEMTEAASILNNLSARSLILLDEIGRGTSTYDGISIAWAMAEYIHDQPEARAKTLFATHYHELNEMAKQFERIRNYSVSVREYEGKIIFLRKLVAGGSEHSFGIHVAKLAGMPPRVVQRANAILAGLEAARNAPTESAVGDVASESQNLNVYQVEDPVLRALRSRIATIDVDNLTPLEALNQLHTLKLLAGLEEGREG